MISLQKYSISKYKSYDESNDNEEKEYETENKQDYHPN